MAKQADLLDVDVARARILACFARLAEETVELADAYGRVLAHNEFAPIEVPPFANSSMDGFAVRADDTTDASSTTPVTLTVIGTIAAGQSVSASVVERSCARIMTGAPVPPGADSIVPFEDVAEESDRIVLSAPIRAGACVRRAGQDIKHGQAVLSGGEILGAPQIGLLASLGFAEIEVVRRPRVAILSTGDELVPPGTSLGPGQIYNSNSPMLAAAVREAGGQAALLPAVSDDPDALRAAIALGRESNLLLTSGGASVGDFDHVKTIIGESGHMDFWRVRMRPGKPLIFGTIGSTPILGLPGNPTSALATFEQFARPAIRTMLGLQPLRPVIYAVLDQDMENRGGRRTFARVTLQARDGRYHVTSAGPQDSAMLGTLAEADGLMEIHESVECARVGDDVVIQVWRLPV